MYDADAAAAAAAHHRPELFTSTRHRCS